MPSLNKSRRRRSSRRGRLGGSISPPQAAPMNPPQGVNPPPAPQLIHQNGYYPHAQLNPQNPPVQGALGLVFNPNPHAPYVPHNPQGPVGGRRHKSRRHKSHRRKSHRR